MTIQMAVRFPDRIAELVDIAVADGWAPNRSALIVTAVQREIRRAAAARDHAILTADSNDDLEELVEWAYSRTREDDLDA